MRLIGLAVVLTLGLSGCGGDEETPARGDGAGSPTTTASPDSTPPPPEAARSVKTCVDLWNADEAIGSTHQVSHTQFVAELAQEARRVPIQVIYKQGDCVVTAPIGNRRIAWFVAMNGRAPFTVPQRDDLRRGERIPYNAVARRDGRIRLRQP